MDRNYLLNIKRIGIIDFTEACISIRELWY